MSNVSVIGYEVEEIQPEEITLETKQAVLQRVIEAERLLPRFDNDPVVIPLRDRVKS